MVHVQAVEYLGEYRLALTFSDGSVRTIDLEAELYGEIFEPLKEVSYFKQVKVNHEIDTIVWPNDADFAPEFLYENSTPIGETARKAA
jgi:hypothetical protein